MQGVIFTQLIHHVLRETLASRGDHLGVAAQVAIESNVLKRFIIFEIECPLIRPQTLKDLTVCPLLETAEGVG